MITFTSRNHNIRNADLITRKAHSLYPHISESKITSMIGKDQVKDLFFGQMSLEYALKFAAERLKIDMDEKNTYKYILEALQKGLGNCYEESKLAEIIARINGQKKYLFRKNLCRQRFCKTRSSFYYR